MDFIMNNWLYILVTGVMFFMMIKGGGCCGGHSNKKESSSGHSHGGGCCGGTKHNHKDNNIQQVKEINAMKDPICGMSVDPNTAIKQKINGEEYYFCSEACRRKFVKKQNLI